MSMCKETYKLHHAGMEESVNQCDNVYISPHISMGYGDEALTVAKIRKETKGVCDVICRHQKKKKKAHDCTCTSITMSTDVYDFQNHFVPPLGS